MCVCVCVCCVYKNVCLLTSRSFWYFTHMVCFYMYIPFKQLYTTFTGIKIDLFPVVEFILKACKDLCVQKFAPSGICLCGE